MTRLTMRSRKKSKSIWKQMKVNINSPKPMGHSEGSPESKVHSKIGLPKEDRNISNKQPNPTSTRTGGTALAGVAQWIECWHANQRVASSIPSQGTCLAHIRGYHTLMFPSLSPPPFSKNK